MSISASAVLVELNISVWPASKIDKEVTERTNKDAAAVSDASQTKKNLFAGTSLRKDIEKYAARIRLYHNLHTLPWADKGERLLPTKMFMDYKISMTTFKDTFEDMCEEFFNAYPALVAQAPLNLGKLYRAEDYPPLEEVRQKFGFRQAISPLPESGDFRLDVPSNDLIEMQSEYEAKFQERLADAMQAPWQRLHTMLTNISTKLTDTKEEEVEGKSKRYHDSLVMNALDLCSLLTKLNVTNDPKLEEARRQLEIAMTQTNIEAIKDSPNEREVVKSRVDAILNKFSW